MVFNEQQNEIPLKIDRIMTAHLTKTNGSGGGGAYLAFFISPRL
jgi:hypothetical protein